MQSLGIEKHRITVYKVIFAVYELNRTGTRPERMQITMRQAPTALSYAGYDYDRELLKKLFGSEDRIGIRSVKKLRDALTHSVKQNAIDELLAREEELFGYMEQFLTKVREFDSDAS